MLRLMLFVLAAVLGIGGFVYVDYTSARRWTGAGGEQLTFASYLGGFSERLIGAGLGGLREKAFPTALANMMPLAPEGWTVRPSVAADAKTMLPKQRNATTKDVQNYVELVAKGRGEAGLDQVSLTYERAERIVIVQAVRYPNVIFAAPVPTAQQHDLRLRKAQFRDRPFMTVRGLDVAEDVLPKGVRGRYFFANISGQIHLNVVASSRMSDEDLVPFFKTLNVQAMNASVARPQPGLGNVPVIVVASMLTEATLDAYVTDLAARQDALSALVEADRLVRAEVPALPVLQDAGRLELEGADRMRSSNCENRAGIKFCGVGGG